MTVKNFQALNTRESHIFWLNRTLLPLVAVFIAAMSSSCFTGVEGTKKITLSREDRRTLTPTEEEKFFVGVQGSPLANWKTGKPFIAADDKAILIFDQQGLPPDPEAVGLGGKILYYEGTGSTVGPDGKNYTSIAFRYGDNRLVYNTGKSLEEALKLNSDQIPMLIDSDMVAEAKALLIGKQFWIRSSLWYDAVGNRIPGMKFIPVTITDVIPASVTFPLSIRFTYGNSEEARIFMNFGNSGTESRSFPALFSLSDIRKKYPMISDETWELICREKVRTGMTKEECKLSLGNPTEVNSGHDYSQTLDLWNYSDGTVLWFEDGLLTRFRR